MEWKQWHTMQEEPEKMGRYLCCIEAETENGLEYDLEIWSYFGRGEWTEQRDYETIVAWAELPTLPSWAGGKQVEELYTVQEVAKKLAFTVRTVYSYIKSGRLKASKMGGQWRVTETDLKAFIDGSRAN
jgi:excisionase family DNA binding protein